MAGGWIALSDRLVVSAAASKEQVAFWSLAKGLGFVVATGLLLFLFVRHAIERDRRAGRELAERDTQLRAIAEAVPGPVFLKDLEGRWLFANPAALEVLGRSASEVLGRTDREIMPDAAASSTAADRRVLESRSAEAMEERVATPAGVRTFLVTRAPYRDAEGRTVGLIGSGSDITEQKSAEAQLQQSPEAGERGPPRRWHRPRLQQPADGDPRRHRVAEGTPRGRPGGGARGRSTRSAPPPGGPASSPGSCSPSRASRSSRPCRST